MESCDPSKTSSAHPLLLLRGAVGGTLMGLANLVPGISGGTMLLASGVYPRFIGAIAEITTFRFRAPALLLLGSVVGSAAVAILLLAGALKTLVEEQRWIMYSLFIGLTLGGVPLVWRMARPVSLAVGIGGLAGLGVMLLMTFASGGAGRGDGGAGLLFLAGLAASSAMILPGVSGGYLLLLLGQYEAILGTADRVKEALLGPAGPDAAALLATLPVVVPLVLGVAVGVIGVSNLLRWLLDRHAKPTLGVLLGLLFGAVVGLWPFQAPRPPEPGDVVRGEVVTRATAASVDPEDWPVALFEPTPAQGAGALGLVLAGFLLTDVVGRLGREREPTRRADAPLPGA